MKNRQILLHDGTTARMNDAEWRSVVNIKMFDDSKTEIIRLTRHIKGESLLLYVMRSAGGVAIDAEQWVPILMGADPKPAIRRAAEQCGIGEDTIKQALAAL